MSSKTHRDGKKVNKNLHVTSRCVAVVFKPIDNQEKLKSDTCQNSDGEDHVELHEDYATERGDGDKYFVTLRSDGDGNTGKSENHNQFDAKKILEEFKFRNKTCYWNPALVDSIKSLEYVGFLEPFTVLVKGDDIHLENIRTAWGRRVLKDPSNFKIEKIGDVNGIEMQVVPQTQFIPLPEALCLIIMDLNNNQIVATLDTVCDRLRQCYHGLHLPSNQLVYETLGTLIRERKVFHTGCGYFVVTPDTFRMHGDDMQGTNTLLSPWTHLHPMYIPAAFSQPPRQPTRSISCQVDADENMIGQTMSHDKREKAMTCNEKVQTEQLGSPRLQRSMSLSVRKSRDRGRREEVSEGSLRRSSSVKGRNDKGKSLPKDADTKTDSKNEKGKEKISLFSKIFGRNKKKVMTPEPQKPVKEYATFSAQFPPPEWMWYQQQLDKHVRTETWVQQQMIKSGTWHHLQSVPTDIGMTSVHFSTKSVPERGSNSVPERSSTLPNTQNVNHDFVPRASRRSHRKSHKHKDRSPVVIANTQQGSTRIDNDDIHTFRNSNGQTNIRLSSLPTRVSPGNEVLHSNYVTHPMFSSTPRYSSIPERYKSRLQETTAHKTELENKDSNVTSGKSKSLRKSHKSKRKSHQDRHSSFNPSSRHVTGLSENLGQGHNTGDISYEYQGQLPQKNSTVGMSQSSGVNCIGLDNGQSRQVQGHQRHSTGRGYQRSRSYRHTNSEQDSVSEHCPAEEIINHNDVHIYANVHVSNTEETKPKIPERTHRRKSCQSHRTDTQLCDEVTEPNQSRQDSYRLCVELPESDRRSENNSDRGTVLSNSSREPSSQDSAVEGTESSEHSMGTVINRKIIVNRQVDRLMAETQELTLGDSGFSSPRVSDISNESKKGDCNLTKEQNGGFMCNNLKPGLRLNNSMGKLDECSEDSYGRITSDALYENVKINQKEVLNNMKYLHKEINVSSQNLNLPQSTQDSCNPVVDFDPKQPVVKKFNFEGDFHVVGVV